MKSAVRIVLFTVLCLGVSAAMAQQPKSHPAPAPAAKPSTPPTIPPEVLKRFWQADAAQQRAQLALTQAQTAAKAAVEQWQASIKELEASCADYPIKQDQLGQDPYCAAKPPVPPAAPAKGATTP